MAISRYSNSFVQNTPIALGVVKTQCGTLLSEYHVSEYWDLRTGTTRSAPVRGYLVSLTQRLTLHSSLAKGFGGDYPPDSYPNYPVLAVQKVIPSSPLSFYIEDYFPKTLNAAINTSQNQGTDSQQSSSVQHTSGSSTSVTNSYEVSASVGFFGEAPTGSIGASESNSKTSTTEESDSRGAGQSRGSHAESGNSMSIKDWASYAFLDPAKKEIAWVWGQEFPWNVIQYRSAKDKANQTINLPIFVQKLLFDGTFVYPPSHIAQFGADFVGTAKWVFLEDETNSLVEDATFSHLLTYWEGSHSADGNQGLKVTMAPIGVNHKVEEIKLNLPVLSLDPIEASGQGNGAVVGFAKSEFISQPGITDRPFRLKSASNNVYISQGKNFKPLTNDDSILTADDITAAAPARFRVQFKLIDPNLELSLHLRHWKNGAADCVVDLTINGQRIKRHVDASENGSGADNIGTITLRLRDYTSPEYYDYLVMGLNTIEISISPDEGSEKCSYSLRALAIQ